jgi:creatinine amidohydrolase/Fe(II)-dependent formamide hydrolase-like protein
MNKIVTICAAAASCSTLAFAQPPRTVNAKDIVELELLTHTEVFDKIHSEGMTSVLIVTGGTEERGPHDVLGGHTIMARHHAVEMAKKLGKTLVAPVLPVAVAATGLREDTNQPGGVQMPPDVFKQVQIAMIESMAMNGFKDIFVMAITAAGSSR